jgi:hypothetical protein
MLYKQIEKDLLVFKQIQEAKKIKNKFQLNNLKMRRRKMEVEVNALGKF